MKYSVAIIDDCVNDIVKLKQLLQQYNDSSEISFDITTFNQDEYEKLISVEYDLYFLDIDMPNKGGFEIARAIEKIHTSSKIIFCSSKEDLVFQSYGNNTFYFIRKSNINDDFNRFIIKLNENQVLDNYYMCKDKKIYYKNILYVDTKMHYIVIHFHNNEILKDRSNIKSILKQFEENCFVNVDNGVLVNLKFIKRINYDNNTIILINDCEIAISIRKIKIVKNMYHKLLAGG